MRAHRPKPLGNERVGTAESAAGVLAATKNPADLHAAALPQGTVLRGWRGDAVQRGGAMIARGVLPDFVPRPVAGNEKPLRMQGFR